MADPLWNIETTEMILLNLIHQVTKCFDISLHSPLPFRFSCPNIIAANLLSSSSIQK